MGRPLESCAVLQVIVTHTHTLHARVLFNFLLECAFIFWSVVSIKAIEKCNPMHACNQKLTVTQNLGRCVKSLSNVCNPCTRLCVYLCVRIHALTCMQSIYLNIINTNCCTTKAHTHTHSSTLKYVCALCLQR